GGARVPRAGGDERLDQGGGPRQGAPRQAVLPAQPARQIGPHRREDRTRRSGQRVVVSAAHTRGARIIIAFFLSLALSACEPAKEGPLGLEVVSASVER